MTEFKVGDRVRITAEWSGHRDKVGVIDEVNLSSAVPRYRVKTGSYPGTRFVAGDIEAVEITGDRVQFEGGGMRDSQNGKPRFDLLLPEGTPFEELFLTRIARLMARGAEHYEDRNWEQFADKAAYDRARSSALRHMMQWLAGETDEDHAASVYFNLMAAEHIKRKMEE